ncbi:MAG TPA: hypothetical protein DD440_06270, partial [Porticoccaceae bacterium]|nr:hypothetical protein [Porticoccaceae bacterium]
MKSLFTTGAEREADRGRRNPISFILVCFCALILVACGGGDYNSDINAAEGQPTLTSVSLAAGDESAYTSIATVGVGDMVTVTIEASEAILAPTVTIAGSAATTVSGLGARWTASRAMTVDDAPGAVSVDVAFSDVEGIQGALVSGATDSSALTFEIDMQVGYVIDGPFQNAQVFGDYNRNGVLDSGEPSAITGADGAYSMVEDASTPEDYTVVVTMMDNTTDSVSGESYANTGVVLKAASGGAVVTPLTTVLEAVKVANPNYTADELASVMGLPAGVDVNNYNPFAAGADPAVAHAVETVFQQVMTAQLVVAEAVQGLGAIAGVTLSAEDANVAALSALASLVVTATEVNLSESSQVADLQVQVKAGLTDAGIEVSDAVADLVLTQAAGTVTKIAAAFDALDVSDFGTTAVSSVSLLKHDARDELEAMS